VADEIELLRRFIDEVPGPSTDAWAQARSAITAARAEEEPAAPRHKLRPPRPRRRLLAITAGTAVAAAAGLLAGLLPGSPVSTGGQQIQTTVYVTRIERALASPRQDDLVGYTRSVYPPGAVARPTGGLSAGRGAGSPWSVGSTVTWAYQGSWKTSAFTVAGQPVFSERTTHAAGRSETVAVIYPHATWWRATAAPAGRTPACPPGITPGLTAIARWAAFIRDELRCGGYRIDGRQRVDGIDALKLAGGKALVALWGQSGDLPAGAGSFRLRAGAGSDRLPLAVPDPGQPLPAEPAGTGRFPADPAAVVTVPPHPQPATTTALPAEPGGRWHKQLWHTRGTTA
jgi:hypothetical protein